MNPIAYEWPPELVTVEPPEPLLIARPIGTLTAPCADDGNELLKTRYVCRGAGALLVGQAGQGKSSLAMQKSILWSLGRECFGITPTCPLRILLVQAENDDGDIWEMFHGICVGLGLTTQEIATAGENILIHTEDSKAGETFLLTVLAPLVETHKPDLIIIDPALAYVEGDTKDAEAVGKFLRRGLNPILHKNKCAALIVHHTTKQRTEPGNGTHDFLYAGAGSTEFSNWARAVLVLETKGNGCYRLHAPKRGARIGWKDAEGGLCFDRYIRHTLANGQICWHDASALEVESASKSGKSKSDLLPHVPTSGSIPQTVLLEKAGASGIGQKKSRAFLDELLEEKTLFLWLKPRKGTHPEKHISRLPQPNPSLPLE